jgi:hypothetical protein
MISANKFGGASMPNAAMIAIPRFIQLKSKARINQSEVVMEYPDDAGTSGPPTRNCSGSLNSCTSRRIHYGSRESPACTKPAWPRID